MKLNEAISRLQIMLGKGVPSDDTRYSDQFLYSLLKTMRIKRLRQKLDASNYISPFNYSTIDCLPLELGKFADCPCFTNDCFILKSKVKIPKIMNTRTGLAIKSVNTITGINISETTATKEQYNKYRILGAYNELKYFIHNDYLFITGSTTLKVVTLTSIFEDPLDLASIDACDPNGTILEATCYDPTTEEYAIDMDLFEDVENMILDKLTKLESQPEDNENDARDAQSVKDNG